MAVARPRLPPGLPPFAAQLALAFAATLVFVLWVNGQWGGPDATRLFVNIASILVPLGAAYACLLRASTIPAELKRPWRLLALACIAWAVGQGAWTAIELATGTTPPSPSVADVGYLLFIPFAASGVVAFGRRDASGAGHGRAVLDGLIVALSLTFTALVFGLETTLRDSSLADAGLVVNVLYPFGDAVLLALVGLRLSRAPSGARGALGLLGAGLVFMAVADFWFLIANAEGIYETGGILDAFWIMGFQAIGLAAVRPGNLERRVAAPTVTPALALLPVYPFVLASVSAAVAVARDGGLRPNLFWMALSVVLLVLVRLMVMLVENLRLKAEVEHALGEVQEAQRVRTQMLSNVTHDLLNPLSPIQLQVGMLRDGLLGDLQPKQKSAMDIIVRNTERVRRLASDLKDLANSESGELRLFAAPTDLAVLARDATATYAGEAETRGITLTCKAPQTVPLHADAARVGQVLDNLLSNALKFTPKGGTITLTVHNHPPGAEVADTGRGLTVDEMARLFKPFSQVHDRSEIPERGTGLGLSISRSIMEGHGGTLDVTSSGHGKGSTFRMQFGST